MERETELVKIVFNFSQLGRHEWVKDFYYKHKMYFWRMNDKHKMRLLVVY